MNAIRDRQPDSRGCDRAGPGADRRARQGHSGDRHLRQGRHRQELHARQPVLHDGAAGQAGAPDRLRPEERHHLAALRRPFLPDHHRDLVEEEARGRGGQDRRRLFQARRRLRHGARRSRGGTRLRRQRHHPRLRTPGEARLPRMGLRLRPARFPRRRGVWRLRPADRARHVPEGHRRRLERPAVALRRQQRLLGGRLFPQDGRQRRRRGPGRQQGRRHRRGAGLRGRRRHPGPGLDPGQRGYPPQERELRDHRPPRRRLGAALRGPRASRWPRRRRCGRRRCRRTRCSGCSGDAVGRGRRSRSRYRRRHARRQPIAPSRRSKSSTRMSDAMAATAAPPRAEPVTAKPRAVTAGGRPCSRPPRRPARAPRWRRCSPTIRVARTTSRSPCARPSAPFGSGCACGAPPRSCRAPPAASTG